MKNFLKIFTIVSAGLLIGGFAGKVIKSERLRITRPFRVFDKGDQHTSRKLIEEADKQADEIENYFI